MLKKTYRKRMHKIGGAQQPSTWWYGMTTLFAGDTDRLIYLLRLMSKVQMLANAPSTFINSADKDRLGEVSKSTVRRKSFNSQRVRHVGLQPGHLCTIICIWALPVAAGFVPRWSNVAWSNTEHIRFLIPISIVNVETANTWKLHSAKMSRCRTWVLIKYR